MSVTRERSGGLLVNFDERKVDAIFAALDQGRRPGAAVGIAIGGKPVYRKGFGLASVELPVTLSPSIRMRIGSTTKHFTAFAYLLLCEDGLARIDDPLGKFLPELHAVTRRVTMRQLMTNTSGVRDATDIVGQFSAIRTVQMPVRTADLLALYKDIDDVNAEPGTRWIYNNGGFVLLGAAIEHITGQTLEQVMWERIFEPLGMYDTLLRRWDFELMPNSASPHRRGSGGAYERTENTCGIDMAGAGAMVSTIDDMLRWLAHMDQPTVGSVATWTAMNTPQKLANGTSTGYGLGLIRGGYRGAQVLFHAGGGKGSNAQMLKVVAAGLDIVVLVNSTDVSAVDLVHRILDACLPGLDPLENSTRPIAFGTFCSPESHRVVQLAASDGDQIVFWHGPELDYAADEQGVLHPSAATAHIQRTVRLIGDPAKPTALQTSDFGMLDEFVRVETTDHRLPEALVGRYGCEAATVEATIGHATEGPGMRTRGRFGSGEFRLDRLTEHSWRARSLGIANPPNAILVFEKDGASFRFSNSCTWDLSFRRAK